MAKMFAFCPRHKSVQQFFPKAQICIKCYHLEKYWERQVDSAAFNPDDLAKAISAILKSLRLLRDGGIITPLRYAALAEEVIGWMNRR